MEIYYFGTNGEKIGPITKEGLLNLAQAGVISEETRFEVGGKKYKGKQIKNLRPIFERLKGAVPPPPTPEPETPPDSPTVLVPPTPAPGELPPPVGDAAFTPTPAGPDPFAGFSIEEEPNNASPHRFDTATPYTPQQADPMPNREDTQSKNSALKTFLLLDENKNLAYNEFWNSYKIARRLLKALYIVMAFIILITQTIVLAREIAQIADEGGPALFIGLFVGIFIILIFQAILFIGYKLILLPYYWMASMIGSAEDIRVIKRAILEK